jgi:hypothetical protein
MKQNFFLKDYEKFTQMPKLKKILPVGYKVFHSGGKTDGWAERHEKCNYFL